MYWAYSVLSFIQRLVSSEKILFSCQNFHYFYSQNGIFSENVWNEIWRFRLLFYFSSKCWGYIWSEMFLCCFQLMKFQCAIFYQMINSDDKLCYNITNILAVHIFMRWCRHFIWIHWAHSLFFTFYPVLSIQPEEEKNLSNI